MMSNTGSASLSNSNYNLRAGGSSSDVINLANFKNPADMRNAQFSATNGFAARTSTLGRLFGTNRDGDGILSPNDLGIAVSRERALLEAIWEADLVTPKSHRCPMVARVAAHALA
jgi:hypothetical protein